MNTISTNIKSVFDSFATSKWSDTIVFDANSKVLGQLDGDCEI